MDEIRKALEETRPRLKASLAAAERELAELRERQRELEGMIARVKAALGEEDVVVAAEPRSDLTLHEAIAIVLGKKGNPWMTVQEIADEVNRRELYWRRDRKPLEPNQVHARTKNYAHMFEKDGPRIRLRQADMLSSGCEGA